MKFEAISFIKKGKEKKKEKGKDGD